MISLTFLIASCTTEGWIQIWMQLNIWAQLRVCLKIICSQGMIGISIDQWIDRVQMKIHNFIFSHQIQLSISSAICQFADRHDYHYYFLIGWHSFSRSLGMAQIQTHHKLALSSEGYLILMIVYFMCLLFMCNNASRFGLDVELTTQSTSYTLC